LRKVVKREAGQVDRVAAQVAGADCEAMADGGDPLIERPGGEQRRLTLILRARAGAADGEQRENQATENDSLHQGLPPAGAPDRRR
jgi:hypothetical protein